MSFKGNENGSAFNVGCDMMVRFLEVTLSMMNFGINHLMERQNVKKPIVIMALSRKFESL